MPNGAPLRSPSVIDSNLPFLDGLRGIASLWVFLSHVLILSGCPHIPLLSEGGLAVDLFMLLSGFLMAHHYLLRRASEPWERPSTWTTFWIRRFFRIAPLFYLLLLVALLFGPFLGQMREQIAALWPQTATSPSRYHDASLSNILAHVSFVFGAVPQYSFETPLPDWSIGLEMQFYLAFPFLMWAASRFGFYIVGYTTVFACLLAGKLFPGFMHGFEMPSFLPLKLHMFFIGIWLAHGRASGTLGKSLLAALSVVVMSRLFIRESLQQLALHAGMVVFFAYLMSAAPLGWGLLDGVAGVIRRLFSNKAAVFLGDTSYGFYLLHLLLLLPIAGGLALLPAYQSAPAAFRFGLCVLLTAPVVYAIAWGLHVSVERGGIRMGKYFSGHKRPSPAASPV